MKSNLVKTILVFNCIVGISFSATAQQYSSPTQPVEIGKAPGVKIKLLSTNGQTKTTF